MTVFGYARVSTDGQTLDAQRVALASAGAVKVFEETASGARTDRRQLVRAIELRASGDVLLVTRVDRLNILAAIGERGASFRSLADGWADTTTPHGRLMLTVLGGLAEFERAKARGVKMGRKPKLTAHQRRETVTDIARSYNVSHTTISRLLA